MVAAPETQVGGSPVAEMQPAPRPRVHIDEFDVMRGVAIIFVVYLHAWFGPWETTPHDEQLWVHIFHLFGHTAVPVFFFISAWLLAKDTSPNWGDFARRKVARIAVPTAFWMLAILLYRGWRSGALDHQMLKDLALFDIAGQYYYLFVLIVFMAASWALRSWSHQRLAKLAVAAFVVNLAMLAWYQSHNPGGDMATLEYRNPAVWVFFWAFGYWAGRRWQTLEWTRALLAPGLAAMAIIAAIYFVRGEAYGAYPRSYFGYTIFLFSCCSLVVYPALIHFIVRAGQTGYLVLLPFRSLSRFAFAIFLIHMPFFVGYVTNSTVSPSELNQDYLTLMNSLFVMGFVTVTAFVILIDAIAPRFAATFMGTTPPPGRASVVIDGWRAFNRWRRGMGGGQGAGGKPVATRL